MDPQLGPMEVAPYLPGWRLALQGVCFPCTPLFSFMLQAVPRAESPQGPVCRARDLQGLTA